MTNPHKPHPKATKAREIKTWLASDENTITRLMSLKKQSRFKKNKAFNGFVLVRKKEDNEFKQFLNILKQNITQIPNNTRMSLAVRTLYFTPQFDTKPDLLEVTKTSPKHWTAVDLLVDAQKNIHSFVLDAANSIGYQEIHHELKQCFPRGKHYIFEEDKIETSAGIFKTRIIQTQPRGCHIFTLQHLSILSQIDTQTLYHIELPALAAKNEAPSGIIQPGYFSETFALAKIFASTESIATIESLHVQNSLITQKGKALTLLEAVRATSTPEGPEGPESTKHINRANYKKNIRYIEKEAFFYQFSRDKKNKIMNARKGYLFLQNRSLFNLNDALKRLDDVAELRLFIEMLHDFLNQEQHHASKSMQPHLQELKFLAYSNQLPQEEIKHNLIHIVENLFLQISTQKNHTLLQQNYNQRIEITLFVFFKNCQAGIIHTNKNYLLAKNACLKDLDEALKSITHIDDIQEFIFYMNNKIQPLLAKEMDLYKHELNELIVLLNNKEITVAQSYDHFMFVAAALFFHSMMTKNSTLRTELSTIIKAALTLYFEISTQPANRAQH